MEPFFQSDGVLGGEQTELNSFKLLLPPLFDYQHLSKSLQGNLRRENLPIANVSPEMYNLWTKTAKGAAQVEGGAHPPNPILDHFFFFPISQMENLCHRNNFFTM